MVLHYADAVLRNGKQGPGSRTCPHTQALFTPPSQPKNLKLYPPPPLLLLLCRRRAEKRKARKAQGRKGGSSSDDSDGDDRPAAPGTGKGAAAAAADGDGGDGNEEDPWNDPFFQVGCAAYVLPMCCTDIRTSFPESVPHLYSVQHPGKCAP